MAILNEIAAGVNTCHDTHSGRHMIMSVIQHLRAVQLCIINLSIVVAPSTLPEIMENNGGHLLSSWGHDGGCFSLHGAAFITSHSPHEVLRGNFR